MLVISLTLFLTSCSVIVGLFDPSGIEVKIASMPVGVSDLKSGQVMTIFQKQKIDGEWGRVKFVESDKSSKKLIFPVAAEFSGDIRLMDFKVPEINDKPQLSFESTARSLVFINPVFLGLKAEKRVEIFKAISSDNKFSDLTKAITESSSLLEKNVVKISNDIAQRIAKKIQIISEEQSFVTPVTNNLAKSSPTPSQNAGFPREVCGDSLPQDSKFYPVNFYPVFIDYSESNLQKLKSQFCRDALKVYRKKLGKDSIQVGSFTTLDRANGFMELMKQNLGSGEIGEPTVILAPRSSTNIESSLLTVNNIFQSFDPPAYAQPSSIYEYKVSEQFVNGISPKYYPLSQKVLLEALSDKLSIAGKSVFAQQVVIFNADKANIPLRTLKGLKNSDILGEYLIYPTEETNIFETLIPSGVSDIFGKRLQPKGSENFSIGSYTVAMTGGSSFRDRKSETGYSAFDYNLLLFSRDFLSLVGYKLSPDNFAQMVPLTASIVSDCHQRLIKDQSSGSKMAQSIVECITDTNNFTKLIDAAQAITGLKGEINNVIPGFVGKFANAVYKSFDVVDKVAQGGKLLAWGQYMARENIEGIYTAKFDVEDKTAFRQFQVDCDKTPAGQFIDLEFEECIYPYASFRLKAKNYSSDWYEVERVIKNPDSFSLSIPYEVQKNLRTATLIRPNSQFVLDFNTPKGIARRFQSNIWKAQGIEKSDVYIPVENVYMKVKRHSGFPSRKLTINCSDNPIDVWNIIFVPKCRPNGIYIDIVSSIRNSIIDLYDENSVNPSQSTIQFSPSLGGSTYTLQSGNSSLNLILTMRQAG